MGMSTDFQFYTYAAYFFQTAGIADPFAVTCITNGIQLVIILIVAASVDRFGRRNIACGGLTTMLVAVTLIGILGVVPQSTATNGLLVFFSCIFSKSLSCYLDSYSLLSRWSSVFRFHRLGFCGGNILSTPSTVHCRIRRRYIVCWWSHNECTSTIHAQRESMGEQQQHTVPSTLTITELGIEDRLLLHWSWCTIRHRCLVHHSRTSWVSTMICAHVLQLTTVAYLMVSLMSFSKGVSSLGDSTRPRPLFRKLSRLERRPRRIDAEIKDALCLYS